MKLKSALWMILFILSTLVLKPTITLGMAQSPNEYGVIEWQLKWENQERQTDTPELAVLSGEWLTVHMNKPLIFKPEHIRSSWIRMKIPTIQDNEGIFFPSIYGQVVTIYLDGKVLFHTERNHVFDLNRVLFSLEKNDSGKQLYIHVQSKMDKLGIGSGFHFGNYQSLVREYAQIDLLDIIVGCAYIFVALVMLVCAVFLERQQLKIWLSLCFTILPIGGLMICYSPFLYTFYGQYGSLYQIMFDLSLFVFLPSLITFFELLFGSGYRKVITYFRRFVCIFSLFEITAMIINSLTNKSIEHFYMFTSITLIGIVMLIQFILMLIELINQLWKRNIDSIILAIGLVIFTTISVTELALFYSSSQTYELTWWKWGLIVFVLTLIVMLGRRFTYQHKLIISYSKDLEIYNSELQRSEKMEIISQLAASVAHEVRNPLQVTRGMLQILGERNEIASSSGYNYYQLAIDELDRASVIISDFLTFAKPEIEQVTELNLSEEFQHVEGIIVPLANLQGGKLNINMPKSLKIMGNSSKLKQAIINLIKNSIEALEGSGVVRIWAYEEQEQVVIHISDNGGGMEPIILERLGEPYFSNKTKGTGLGLMVTFRIIEAMKGTVAFKSEKGVGTEVTLRFPAARFAQTNAKVSI